MSRKEEAADAGDFKSVEAFIYYQVMARKRDAMMMETRPQKIITAVPPHHDPAQSHLSYSL